MVPWLYNYCICGRSRISRGRTWSQCGALPSSHCIYCYDMVIEDVASKKVELPSLAVLRASHWQWLPVDHMIRKYSKLTVTDITDITRPYSNPWELTWSGEMRDTDPTNEVKFILTFWNFKKFPRPQKRSDTCLLYTCCTKHPIDLVAEVATVERCMAVMLHSLKFHFKNLFSSSTLQISSWQHRE